MQAIVQVGYGSPGVLEPRDIDRPEIGDGDVLVRVRAASIHVGDVIVMSGSPYLMRLGTGLRKPKNRVPGTDIAGTIVFLSSKEADYLNGAVLNVDGGWLAR